MIKLYNAYNNYNNFTEILRSTERQIFYLIQWVLLFTLDESVDTFNVQKAFGISSFKKPRKSIPDYLSIIYREHQFVHEFNICMNLLQLEIDVPIPYFVKHRSFLAR